MPHVQDEQKPTVFVDGVGGSKRGMGGGGKLQAESGIDHYLIVIHHYEEVLLPSLNKYF